MSYVLVRASSEKSFRRATAFTAIRRSGPSLIRKWGAAVDVIGVTPQLEPIAIDVADHPPGTLVAFLSSGCLTCYEFWDAMAQPEEAVLPGGARAVVVTKDQGEESVAKIRELAPPNIAVVMSTAAWEAYDVPGAPYFVWVSAETRTVQGVGAATKWESVLKLLRDSLAEMDAGTSEADKVAAEEAELVAAGITPGHLSLNDPLSLEGP